MKYLVFFAIFSLFFVTVNAAAAQIAIPSSSPTPTPIVYTLPYPGILRDNPLYKIKAFRDWLVSVLIADPLKKASFDILQADKRLVAAQDLLQENPPKEALALETLSKGENYFFQAIGQMKQAQQQGERVYDTVQKLRLSNAKHLEIILQMEEGKKEDFLRGLHMQEKRIREFGKTVEREGDK
jgi:hypothetical protein